MCPILRARKVSDAFALRSLSEGVNLAHKEPIHVVVVVVVCSGFAFRVLSGRANRLTTVEWQSFVARKEAAEQAWLNKMKAHNFDEITVQVRSCVRHFVVTLNAVHS